MPAGVAVMRSRLGQSSASRKPTAVRRALLVARRAAGRCPDGADVAEQLVEEAALASQRRSLAIGRIDRRDQLLAGLVDANHVAGLVEADAVECLLRNSRVAERELVGVARHIIPVVGRELAGERRPTERLF